MLQLTYTPKHIPFSNSPLSTCLPAKLVHLMPPNAQAWLPNRHHVEPQRRCRQLLKPRKQLARPRSKPKKPASSMSLSLRVMRETTRTSSVPRLDPTSHLMAASQIQMLILGPVKMMGLTPISIHILHLMNLLMSQTIPCNLPKLCLYQRGKRKRLWPQQPTK